MSETRHPEDSGPELCEGGCFEEREKTLVLDVTLSEQETLEALADKLGIKVSALQRIALRGYIAKLRERIARAMKAAESPAGPKRGRPPSYDWEAIRREYVYTVADITFEELAGRHRCSTRALRKHATAGGWGEQRRQYLRSIGK